MTKCQQKTRQSLKDPARRDLIAGAAGAVGLVVFGGFIGHSTVSEASLVRPPGSRPEAEFLAMRTPVMTFHLGHCDFCKKCAEVCPTGAIEDFAPETVRIGIAVVTESCIALRTGACTKCYEACPYDAVTLDARRRPIVDSLKCNGCGMCEYICPSNIFQAYQGKRVRGIIVRPLEAPKVKVLGEVV